jgi:GTPase KRas protein
MVAGGQHVGKTALVWKITDSPILHGYISEFEDVYTTHMKVDSEVCKLQILDSANWEFHTTRDNYIRGCQGFIFVYDLTSRASFDEIQHVRSQVLQIKEKNAIPSVLVGNKCDLSHERKVPIDEGLNLAKSWKCPFFEVSAKTGQNLTECVSQLAREIHKEIGNNDKHITRKSKRRVC